MSHAADIPLSPEGEARRAAHRFLLDRYIGGRETTFRGEGEARILEEVTIDAEPRTLAGEVKITLPPGTARVAGMFRYLVLRGDGLDAAGELVADPYSGGGGLSESTHEPTLYRVKMPAMPTPSEAMAPFVLRFRIAEGRQVRLTSIGLNSQGRLPVLFDDVAYRDLGAAQPRLPIRLAVDLDRELVIAGTADIRRDRFCRYYALPGQPHESLERWAAERNFRPGRQILKLQPALVVGYRKNQPQLAEDPDRPGAADRSFFDAYDSSPPPTIEPFRSVDYAMCLNDYPDFQSIPTVGRGTPQVEHFGKAAELAASVIADQLADGGRTATWWEAKNESTIKAEWDYHWRREDSWTLLADFHNAVADAVHDRTPGIRVGGPSSAWMQLHVNNFDLYRRQARFMDETRGRLDFYSHHFYEDHGSLGAWERRSGGPRSYTNYLLGRLEATLDLLAAHMRETDNVRPMLITECGSLQRGRGPSDYWLRVRSFSAYLHKLMRRPDQIDLAVPFAFLTIPWNPQSGDAAFIPHPGEPPYAPLAACGRTPVADFFELWRDFDGRRHPVRIAEAAAYPFLDATAVRDGNQLQIALTNMGGRRLAVDLSSIPSSIASQRRLRFEGGAIRYDDALSIADLAAVPVDVEETTILTLTLSDVPPASMALERTSHYAAGTARPATPDSDAFRIAIANTTEVAHAELVIGIAREGGLSAPLAATLNGQTLEITSDWAIGFDHLMAPVRITIDPESLAESNTVRITPQDGLTITSVHLETDVRLAQ